MLVWQVFPRSHGCEVEAEHGWLDATRRWGTVEIENDQEVRSLIDTAKHPRRLRGLADGFGTGTPLVVGQLVEIADDHQAKSSGDCLDIFLGEFLHSANDTRFVSASAENRFEHTTLAPVQRESVYCANLTFL